MFRVYLRELASGEVKRVVNFTARDVDVEEMVGKGQARVEIRKTGSTYNLKGTLTFKLRHQCARCLEEFEREYEEKMDYIFRRGSERMAREIRLKGEDLDTYYIIEDHIDLLPLFHDTILLAIPMKPLCREDCRGLCPVCGHNLNKGDCEHVKNKEKEIDPRWAKLLEIKTEG